MSTRRRRSSGKHKHTNDTHAILNSHTSGRSNDAYKASAGTKAVAHLSIHRDSYREMFMALIETVDEAAIVVDRDLRVVALNNAARELLGIRGEDGVGVECFRICRGSRCGIDCPMAMALRSGVEPPETEMRLLTANNGACTVRVRIKLLRDRHQKVVGGIELLHKIAHGAGKFISRQRDRFGPLIGHSKAMRQIYQLIEDISDSLATVLIYGETGTGKELVAQAIHQTSPRANGPFVKVNCGAIPETLLEAELFGYVKGAFTDAVTDKPGRFELAHGGTIFLDEIGEISPSVQVKLLRVLQEREFERLGGTRTIKVDVRIIAATNKDLRKAVREGHFREDLYYRLNVIPIYIPPLRERRDDIPLLVDYFVEKLRRETGRPIDGVSPDAMCILLNHSWPGNIRELENALEYAFVVCKGGYIQPYHLPIHIQQSAAEAGLKIKVPLEPEASNEADDDEDPEKGEVLALLEVYDWDLEKCARALNTTKAVLWRKMKKWGIECIPRAK